MDTPPEMFRYLGREDLLWTVSDVSPAELVGVLGVAVVHLLIVLAVGSLLK